MKVGGALVAPPLRFVFFPNSCYKQFVTNPIYMGAQKECNSYERNCSRPRVKMLDSRGNPTVEVEVQLDSGAIGRAIVPAAPARASMKRSNCATATRSAMAAKACSRRWTTSTTVIADELLGHGRHRPGRHRREHDRRTWMGPETRASWAPMPFWPCRMAVAKAAAEDLGHAALPLSRRRQRAHAAGADDEHSQRRQACGQQHRLPGIHGHAGRRTDRSRECLRWGVEIYQSLKKVLHDGGLQHQRRRRRRLRPSLGGNVKAIEVIMQAIEKAGYRPGEACLHCA